MSRCNSCGGIIGKDCFNPVECAYISEQQATQHDKDHYMQGRKDALKDRLAEWDGICQDELWDELIYDWFDVSVNRPSNEILPFLKSKYTLFKKEQ
jgi:hypothetical protein